MKYQIEQVKANDYDELLALLNRVFNKTEGRTFDISLPAMWERDDEHASADMYVDRGNVRRFFKTISAYTNKIWVAIDRENRPIGFVAASEDGTGISEH